MKWCKMEIKDFDSIELNYDYPNPLDVEFEAAWAMVEKHCSEFLKIVRQTEKFLYRGTNNSSSKSSIFIAKNREDRVPIWGGNRKYAKICDLYLKTSGFTALRGNSTFCNSSYSKAQAWGNVFMIFPVNGFSFSYSAKWSGIPATAYTYPTFSYTLLSNYDNTVKVKKQITQDDLNKAAEEFVKTNMMRNTDLDIAMMDTLDIWFHGKYIAFNIDYTVSNNYLKPILKKMGFNYDQANDYL